MPNIQEPFIKQLSENTISRKFVFKPNKFGKKKNWEPADLVWACNNILILFYMQSTQDQDFEKGDQHNLTQAKGWFRRWKLDQSLNGHNRFQNFSFPYDASRHVIVISIVKSSEDLALFHFDFEKNLNVDICVTLPESAIFIISSMDAGFADFLHILSLLRSGSTPDGRYPELMEIILHYYSSTIKIADPNNLLQKIDPKKGIIETFNILVGHKFFADEDFAISRFFNDLLLIDLYRLAVEIKQKMDIVDNDKSLVVMENVPLSFYNFVFSIGPNMGGLASTTPRFIEYVDEIVKSGKRVIIMMIDLQSGVETLINLYNGPTFSETSLQN